MKIITKMTAMTVLSATCAFSTPGVGAPPQLITTLTASDNQPCDKATIAQYAPAATPTVAYTNSKTFCQDFCKLVGKLDTNNTPKTTNHGECHNNKCKCTEKTEKKISPNF